MPELPEVEIVCRQLNERLAGRRIIDIEIFKKGREFPSGDDFIHVLRHKTIDRVYRRAKVIVFDFGEAVMLGHLKMTGKFVFVGEGYMPTKHDRIRFVLDDDSVLIWSDIRQFGYVKVMTHEESGHVLADYGLEPLEAAPEVLAQRLRKKSSRTVKAMLLDQGIIAGIGNIYADEACHRAGIRPSRRVSFLTSAERLRLVIAIQKVLKESLAQKGTSANDYVDTEGNRGGFLSFLRVYGREGEACRNCQALIKRIVLGGHGTHYCAACQK